MNLLIFQLAYYAKKAAAGLKSALTTSEEGKELTTEDLDNAVSKLPRCAVSNLPSDVVENLGQKTNLHMLTIVSAQVTVEIS